MSSSSSYKESTLWICVGAVVVGTAAALLQTIDNERRRRKKAVVVRAPEILGLGIKGPVMPVVRPCPMPSEWEGVEIHLEQGEHLLPFFFGNSISTGWAIQVLRRIPIRCPARSGRGRD